MHRHSTNALSFAGVCVFFLCSASPILEHSPIAAAAADVKRGPEAAFVASPQAWLHKERGRSHMTCSSSRSVRMAACGAKRAAVVGAGAAGLAAAKQLRADGHTVRVFEMSNDVGGVWQYNDTVEADPMGNPVDMRVHSSMYVSLRTNLPREVMAFDDFPFTDEFDERRFPHHSAVQRYLSKYADTFELRPLISFDRKVTNLRPVRSQSAEGEHKGFRDVSWSLEHSAAGGGGQVEEEEFDVVMVCNGHYSEPWSPVFEGQESWSGTTSHSHNYRSPSAFAGKRVVVIGASASGEDISRDVSSVAAKVWLSARSWQNPDWGAPDAPPFGPQQNIERKVPIKRLLASGGVEFEDGSILEDVHHLLFCTGYRSPSRALRLSLSASSRIVSESMCPCDSSAISLPLFFLSVAQTSRLLRATCLKAHVSTCLWALHLTLYTTLHPRPFVSPPIHIVLFCLILTIPKP